MVFFSYFFRFCSSSLTQLCFMMPDLVTHKGSRTLFLSCSSFMSDLNWCGVVWVGNWCFQSKLLRLVTCRLVTSADKWGVCERWALSLTIWLWIPKYYHVTCWANSNKPHVPNLENGLLWHMISFVSLMWLAPGFDVEQRRLTFCSFFLLRKLQAMFHIVKSPRDWPIG